MSCMFKLVILSFPNFLTVLLALDKVNRMCVLTQIFDVEVNISVLSDLSILFCYIYVGDI